MSTSIRPSLTKPRRSQVILEGTAALVAAVLLIWLFFWFITRRATDLQVRAFYVQPGNSFVFVPHQEADFLGLSGGRADAGGELSDLGGLSNGVDEWLSIPGSTPVVVSISAPLATDPKDQRLFELIQNIARKSRRDALILLDVAQIDSDRELGVFGNAPDRKLQAQLEGLTPPNQKIYVLCSAAPGQKSWMIDGLGRSAFSYFAQKGLARSARPDADKGPLTVEALHQFVLANTSRWVREHRRGAIQTPVLLTVGPKAKGGSFLLPKLREPKAPALSASDATKLTSETSKAPATGAPPKEAAAEKGAPPDSPEALRSRLFAEWGRHENLEKEDRPPYRDAPAHWRIYEASLLRAERLVRASRNDRQLADMANRALSSVEANHSQLQKALAAASEARARFPFRSVKGNPSAEQTLNASLKYVTNNGLNDLAAIPPPAPSPTSGAGAGGSGKVSLTQVLDEPPSELEAAALASWPEHYLELQLPAWALRFHDEFKVKPFRDNPQRGLLLRDVVQKRLIAESALALDHRGLVWIKDKIEEGDGERRQVQDDLFAEVDGTLGTKTRIESFGKKYTEAEDQIKRYHEARSLFEKIAARLPYLGEWAVLDDLRTAENPDGGRSVVAPSRLKEVFDSAADLAREIEASKGSEKLDDVVQRAKSAFAKLEEDYHTRVRAILSQPTAFGWRDFDDVLAVPTFGKADREDLLDAVVALETETPTFASASPEDPPSSGEPGSISRSPIDPGFRQKALELARLDTELRRLAAGPRNDSEPRDELDKLRRIAGADDPQTVEERTTILDAFASFSKSSRDFGSRSRKPRQDGDLARNLVTADRESRLRTASECKDTQDGADRATTDLERFARRASIRFQAERLALDNARDNGPASLNALADKEYPGGEARRVAFPQGYLRPEVGSNSIKIDRESRSTTLTVGVLVEGDDKNRPVPEGRAFVGVLVLEPTDSRPPDPAPDAASEKGGPLFRLGLAETPGGPKGGRFVSPEERLAGGLFSIGGKAQNPLTFQVTQQTTADKDNVRKKLSVKAFYRGRVYEDRPRETVEVVCQKFGDFVEVRIKQDRDALEDLYEKEKAKSIKDQFDIHPKKGYMHRKGQLDYVLDFINRTPETQVIHIERVLKDEKGETRPYDAVDLSLKPGDTQSLKDKLTAVDVEIDKPKVMTVTVTNAKNDKPVVEKYTFKQEKLEDYIEVVEDRGPYAFNPGENEVDCLFVYIVRKSTDGVTEPIFYRDIDVTFFGEPPKKRSLEEKGVLERNESIVAHRKIDPRFNVMPYEVKIKSETVKEGKFRAR